MLQTAADLQYATSNYTAALGGYTEMVATLVQGNANPDLAKERTGFSPIFAAAYTGFAETIEARARGRGGGRRKRAPQCGAAALCRAGPPDWPQISPAATAAVLSPEILLSSRFPRSLKDLLMVK